MRQPYRVLFAERRAVDLVCQPAHVRVNARLVALRDYPVAESGAERCFLRFGKSRAVESARVVVYRLYIVIYRQVEGVVLYVAEHEIGFFLRFFSVDSLRVEVHAYVKSRSFSRFDIFLEFVVEHKLSARTVAAVAHADYSVVYSVSLYLVPVDIVLEVGNVDAPDLIHIVEARVVYQRVIGVAES